MARHSRDMIRHHRERMIAKRRKYFAQIWHYVPEHLSKFSAHSHHCDWCDQPYKRTNYDWRHDPQVIEEYYYQ